MTAKEENIPKDRKAIKSIELETALACDVGILSSPKKEKKNWLQSWIITITLKIRQKFCYH